MKSPINYAGNVLMSSDNGDTWTLLNADFFRYHWVQAFAINSHGHLFVGTSTTAGAFRSTDNGQTWTTINNGLTNPFILTFAINKEGQIFAGSARGSIRGFHGIIFRSNDNGDNWTEVNSGEAFNRANAIVINPAGHIFAGTDRGVYRSTDGENWQFTGLPDVFVYSLAIDSSGHLLAGTNGNGVFRATSDGENWTPVNAGFNNTKIRSIAINASGQIFAATNIGIFRFIDTKDIWKPMNNGLTDGNVNSIANTYIRAVTSDSSGYLFVGTEGGGVFRSVEPTTSVREITDDVPTSFSLEQNYPNPFNPSTTIQFTLPCPIYVTLKVYNTLGEEVVTLISENLPAGKHQAEWNPHGLAGGIYFYRLRAGGFVETKKLVLIK